MEGNILLDSDDFLLVLPNEPDRCDTESGIGSLSSNEDLRSTFLVDEQAKSVRLGKPKRRVQFQSDENLVLIREIPPRGFYGSDVSDDDEYSSSDDDDDDDEDDGDEDDTENDDGGRNIADEGSDESESSDDSDENQHTSHAVPRLRNQAPRGTYSVMKLPGKSADKISKITSMTLLGLPNAKKASKTQSRSNNATDIKTKSGSRKQRVKKSDQNVGANKTSYRRVAGDGKKRRNVPSTVMNSTSSSRNKEIQRLKVVTYSSTSSHAKNAPVKITPKIAARISIDTPFQSMCETSITSTGCYSWEDNRPSYSCDFSNPSVKHNNVYNVSKSVISAGNMTKLGGLPDIETTHSKENLKSFPRNRRYNAWQVANGQFDAKIFHTPSIAPMWENVHSLSSPKIPSKIGL